MTTCKSYWGNKRGVRESWRTPKFPEAHSRLAWQGALKNLRLSRPAKSLLTPYVWESQHSNLAANPTCYHFSQLKNYMCYRTLQSQLNCWQILVRPQRYVAHRNDSCCKCVPLLTSAWIARSSLKIATSAVGSVLTSKGFRTRQWTRYHTITYVLYSN